MLSHCSEEERGEMPERQSERKSLEAPEASPARCRPPSSSSEPLQGCASHSLSAQPRRAVPQLVTCEGEAGPLWPNHHLMLGAGGKRGQGGWTPCSRRIQVGGSLGTTHTISHHHPGVSPRGKAEEALGGQRLKEQTRAAPQVGTVCAWAAQRSRKSSQQDTGDHRREHCTRSPGSCCSPSTARTSAVHIPRRGAVLQGLQWLLHTQGRWRVHWQGMFIAPVPVTR